MTTAPKATPKNIAATAATLLANLGMAEVEDNPVGRSNIEALPSIKEGIDRPGARSQNCDGSTHRRQQDPTSQVVSA